MAPSGTARAALADVLAVGSADEWIEGIAAATYDPPEALAAASANHIFQRLFALLATSQRAGEGRFWYVENEVAIAALQCQFGSEEEAADFFAQFEIGGRIDVSILRQLFEAAVPEKLQQQQQQHTSGENPVERHERVCRLVLAVARDFEQRMKAGGDFKRSGKAREFFAWLRDTEERRFTYELERRHAEERDSVTRGQSAEARDFNRQWKRRMEAFNQASKRAVEEMRARHEQSLDEFVQTKRVALVEHFRLHARDKETLEAVRTLKKLSMSGDFKEAKKFQKHVEVQTKKEAAQAEGKAEEELQKKLEVHRWQQRLEVKGLMAKIERVRREHRAQWEDGLARLVLAQKNAVTDVHARHAREAKHAAEAMRAAFEPRAKPTARPEPRANYSLLSPRRRRDQQAAAAGGGGDGGGGGGGFMEATTVTTAFGAIAGPAGFPLSAMHPPPTQRPSRMAAAHAVRMIGASNDARTWREAGVNPPSPTAPHPPRPFSSEHVPRSQPSSRPITPRMPTSAR